MHAQNWLEFVPICVDVGKGGVMCHEMGESGEPMGGTPMLGFVGQYQHSLDAKGRLANGKHKAKQPAPAKSKKPAPKKTKH